MQELGEAAMRQDHDFGVESTLLSLQTWVSLCPNLKTFRFNLSIT